VPLAALCAARGPLALELRGGSPFHEEAIAAEDVPQRQDWLPASLRAPRLMLRVSAPPPAADACPAACVVAAPLVPLVATYNRYLQDHLRRAAFSATSSAIADPVLALVPRLASLEVPCRALHALFAVRRAARTSGGADSEARNAAAQAALQDAVCELWPAAEAYVAARPPGDDARPDDVRVLANYAPALARVPTPESPAEARAQARDLVESALALARHISPGGGSPRRHEAHGLFAPFSTSELSLHPT
jgi:hypothetical protein